MLKLISKFLFRLFGWKTVGEVPPLKKFVVLQAPHTSGWDLIIGLCGRFIFDMDLSLMIKKEAFRFPFVTLLRWFGGIPIDRHSKHNVVEQVVQMFNQRDHFILAIAPEGTRKYAPKWKTGFYYIALQANVPFVLGYIDFEHKAVGIGPTFYPTGDVEKDIETIKAFYRPIKGKYPENGVR